MEQREGIRTFLIADVRGYTVFTQQHGDEAAAKLTARFAQIARGAVEERDGSVIEFRGDEALAVFVSSRQAIVAATLLQDRFVEQTVADPSLPLPVGIGLDAGEAVQLETGYRGGALNLAARLCGRAGPGEILASQSVVHLAGKVDNVRYSDRGDLRLKGLADPVRAFRVISERGDAAERIKPFVARPRERRATTPVRLAGRHPALAILLALALVAAIVLPASLILRGRGSDRISGDALALVGLETGELEGSVPLEARPGDVDAGGGVVWATLPDRGAVVQVDPETMGVVDTVPVGADPSGIAIGAGSVWVTNGGGSTVSRISPARNSVVQVVEVPEGPSAIAVGDGGVWVANSLNDSVSRLDPVSGEVQDTIEVGDQPVGLAVDETGVWVANAGSGTVSRIDPEQGLVVQTIDVGNAPHAIAPAPGEIWAANLLDGTVSQIDPDTNAVVRTIPAGASPNGVVVGDGSVWVSDESDGSVTRIDRSSGSGTTIPLGSEAGGVAMGDGAIWISVRGPEIAHVGGTLTVTSSAPLDTIDPALAYYSESWNILSLTNDGLVGFKRVGGLDGAALVPDLATSIPRPVDGGKTYTFQLRSGIRYSNGAEVQPEDFRRALERVFRLESGGAYHYAAIEGADVCARRPDRCDLSRGVVPDDEANTVTFHLAEADPDFLFRLALPFAFAVPAGVPDGVAEHTPIPATGPYVIEGFDNARQLVLARNPEFVGWASAARPDGFPDRIVWRFSVDDGEQVTETLRGGSDLMFRELPPGILTDLASSHAGQVHFTPRGGVYFMTLDTVIPPFSDVRVRRALNFAIDRTAIADLFAGTGSSTCQILPPNFPGYVPYCPYTRSPNGTWTAPDLDQARSLVEMSATEGSKVTVWATPEYAFGIPVAVGRYFVDLLDELGYRATLRVVHDSDRYFSVTLDPSRQAQIAFSGWSADYPAESGFIIPVASCAAASSSNVQFCDPGIDRRMERASRLQLTDLAAAHRLWSSIEHDITDRAPWVPLVSRSWVNFVSERLENYQVNPEWGPLIDQMWVQ